MARLDACHEQVANALRNDGWQVDKTPFGVRAMDRRAIIDIRATRGTNGHTEQILLVEVKCFAQPKSWTNELYAAIGQYLVYRAMLQDVNVIIPLYLSVPDDVYIVLFDSTIQRLIQDNGFKLVIIDLEREAIVRWIR